MKLIAVYDKTNNGAHWIMLIRREANGAERAISGWQKLSSKKEAEQFAARYGAEIEAK